MSKPTLFLLALFVIVADRLTKMLAVERLPLDVKSVVVIPNFLYFTRTSNTGSAFSLFQGATPILAFIALACALGVVVYVFRFKDKMPLLLGIGLALPLGGALGNFYDRAFHGFVVDFIDFWFGRYEWPVFNVADSCICVGVALIAIYTIRLEAHSSRIATSSQSESVNAEPSVAPPK